MCVCVHGRDVHVTRVPLPLRLVDVGSEVGQAGVVHDGGESQQTP